MNAFLMLCIALPSSQADERVRTADRPATVSAALGKIFDDAHVQQEALFVHFKAAAMSPENRFRFLSQWVLPSQQHDTLRMQADFTQTCPVPAASTTVATAGRMLFSGGDLIALAIDLVDVAKELDRVAEIRQRVEAWTAVHDEGRRSQAAMLAIIAMAERDFTDADQHIRDVRTLATTGWLTSAERGAEMIVAHVGGNHKQTQELAGDLAGLLYNDAQNGKWRASERWKRQTYALKQRLETGMANPAAAEQTQPLRNWVSTSRMTSETRGSAYPESAWQLKQGAATHVSGHDDDYLYFVSPLTGEFSVEADLTTFGLRDIQLGFGGYWSGARYDLKSVVRSFFRWGFRDQPIDPPLTRMLDWMRVRVDVRNNRQTTYINGRKIFQKSHPPGSDPWLSIHSWWMAAGTVKNLRIHGDPVIPEQIDLAPQSDLSGWLPYFDESVGGSTRDWFLQRLAPRTARITSPVSRILVGTLRPELSGTNFESLLRYHRPMLEDGTIEYEFYYEPDRTHVHPAVDRLCFMLNPDGVAVHWVTDAKCDPTELDPANQVKEPEYSRHKGPLPLQAAQWNKVTLKIRGDAVEVSLNGQLVFSRPLEPTNMRTFGLFHYADQTEARVRNIHWRGEWPRELPEPAKQDLADVELARMLGDVAELPVVLRHDFRQNAGKDKFLVLGESWDDVVDHDSRGLHMTRSGGDYVSHVMTTPLTMSGDFEVTATFDSLDFSVMEDGEGSVQLTVVLADKSEVLCHLSRKQYSFAGPRTEQLLQPSISRERDGQFAQEFFDSPAEEATSGALRLVRRGSQMFFLFSEGDSTQFRLILQQEVGTADATPRLSVAHHKTGSTSVIWKTVTVRAESASGLSDVPLFSLQELDQQRNRLPAGVEFNLAVERPVKGTTGLERFRIWGDDTASFSRDTGGLTVEVPGSDEWKASGLVPHMTIEGDFDISLHIDILKLDPAAKGDDSAVLLQTEFQDVRASASEIKFSIDANGQHAIETFLRRKRSDNTVDVQRNESLNVPTVSVLRLARRGDLIYQVFRESDGEPAVILGAMTVGGDPLSDGFLRALIHTGGAGRKTIVRFKSLSIHAEKIDQP